MEGIEPWLRKLGRPSIQPVPEALCTREFEALWGFLGALGPDSSPLDSSWAAQNPSNIHEREAGYKENLFPNLSSSSSIKARTTLAAKPVSNKQAEGQLTQPAQAVSELQFQELAYEAYARRLQHVSCAIECHEQQVRAQLQKAELLLDVRLPGTTLSPAAECFPTLLLQSVETHLREQVAAYLAAGNLGPAEIDWNAASASVESANSCSARMNLLAACVTDSRRMVEALHAAEGSVNVRLDVKQVVQQAFSSQGIPDVQQRLHNNQRKHVRLFFAAQRASMAEQQALKNLDDLRITLERLCGGSETGSYRKRLLTLVAESAGNRAAVQVLELQMADLRKELCHLTKLHQSLASTRDMLISSRMHNMATDHVAHNLAGHASTFSAAWLLNSEALKAMVSEGAAEAASGFPSLAGKLASACEAETRALAQVPARVTQQTSVGRQQQPKAWAQLELDAKSKSAWLAALDKGIKLLTEAQTGTQTDTYASLEATFAAYQGWSKAESAALVDLENEASPAIHYSREKMPHVLQVWWEQPALDAVPWIQWEGKGARDWLMHIQTLHAAKTTA